MIFMSEKKGMSTGAKIGIVAAAAAVIAGGVVLASAASKTTPGTPATGLSTTHFTYVISG